MTRTKKAQKKATIIDKRGRVRSAHNTRLSERGQSQSGGSWNLNQAAAWSGIGSGNLRAMAKRGEIPCIKIGRRIVIPRQGFIEWFNRQGQDTAA